MRDMVDFVNKFVSKVYLRDDIAGRLKIFHNSKRGITSPAHYFFINDLCLPADTFARQKLGKEKNQKTKEILAQGNKIHFIAQSWLKQHENYNGSEAILDGLFVGVHTRGRIDGRIGNSIVEIKSVGKLPENPQEIIQKYPQYLEQVAFYSAIDPLKPKDNYLVFITREHPYKIKSFKLSILNFKMIMDTIKRRAYLLGQVLEGKQRIDVLGKCRYCYEKDCNVKKEGNCPMLELQPLECEVKEYIKLTEDAGFTLELQNIRGKYGEDYRFYSSYDILCPRKYCLKELYGEEEFEDKNFTAKAYFDSVIYKFVLENNGKSSMKRTESKFTEFRLNKSRWFNDKTSVVQEGRAMPFIECVTDFFNADKPSNYKIAELGVYLMAHGLNKGLIFSYYPKKGEIKVFEVTFDFRGDYLSEIRKIIKGLKNPKNFMLLPKGPDWMCKKCPFSDKCKE